MKKNEYIEWLESTRGAEAKNVAAKLGFSTPALSFWRLGANSPTVEAIAKIVEISGVSYESVVLGSIALKKARIKKLSKDV